MRKQILGVIGGSGLYELPGIRDVQPVRVSTPFGEPSDTLMRGRLGDVEVIFLPRHGVGHRLLPSEVPFRANVFALKQLGAEFLVSIGAVGSLREQLAPGHVVIPDQFIDRTVARQSTFFDAGVVVHVSLADPVCSVLADAVEVATRAAGGTVHRDGTYLCMEGPQFSTRAESNMYRQWGADVIGMTNWQEAKLAREAELCFASLALVTDYDCWKSDAEHVVIEEVLRILAANAELAQRAVAGVAERLPAARTCACATALQNAIITNPAKIPSGTRERLAPLIGKYLSDEKHK
ncbi:MAG TPA: S-methyl-5'-thioadenosine phosphorylase [Candidatus Dormibacteraeota bacterium]|nr:S-methyl-5'-thioadenosine phosphorylase [Candidatus Dormibacteraeota bacterium]